MKGLLFHAIVTALTAWAVIIFASFLYLPKRRHGELRITTSDPYPKP